MPHDVADTVLKPRKQKMLQIKSQISFYDFQTEGHIGSFKTEIRGKFNVSLNITFLHKHTFVLMVPTKTKETAIIYYNVIIFMIIAHLN
jgi:hypothetical protein